VLTITSLLVVHAFAERVIQGIADNIRNKQVTPFGAMNTTGHAANSLFYRIQGNSLIIGSTWAYITVLEDGRKPGKMPPPTIIEKWMNDKPIGTDIPRSSLAYLIARKIGQEGSLLYRMGGKSGVLSDYLNQNFVHENLTVQLQKELVDEVTNILFKPAA
jgi:hypothetical protein